MALIRPGTAEVQVLGARLLSTKAGATKLAMMFTATVTIRNARQPSTRKKVLGIAAMISVGLSITRPLSWNCPPQSSTVIAANTRIFTGKPQKLPTRMVLRHGEEARKVAEVEDQRAVDRQP